MIMVLWMLLGAVVWSSFTMVPIYLVKFKSFSDMEVVFAGYSWNFNDDIILLDRCDADKLPDEYVFTHFDLHVHIHGLPVNDMTPSYVYSIASILGKVGLIHPDESTLWSRYARVRVHIDITRPLKETHRVKLPSSKECLISFKYEKLTKL
ncbi:protein of unknown function DUF4283 [Macleaya cordata]|uniref:Zinc knuckle CX2CX4HX4C domain-containing protein n=1 Tax=Macleaya cordata TaxID=56857 RepID=A0A200R0Z4_MACCD|nr:protein of unknown function DUF4283 [Macleaya cordata]